MVEVERAELASAVSEGFDQTTAEKVVRLLGVLREIQADARTRDRFTLKGGTALNIFHASRVPRLSVDLDLMVTGFQDAAPERPRAKRPLRSLGRS